ncbi:MAG: hypothetical protein ABIN96_09300 [Rubrivivax sp.]
MSDHCPQAAAAGAAAPAALRRRIRAWRALLVAAGVCSATLSVAVGLVIQRPQAGQSLRDNRGNVTVQLALEDNAELPRGFAFRLLLDGKPAAPDVPAKRIPLTGVDRGTHRLQALIVDGEGQVLTQSPTITFTLHRASRLHR